MYVLVYAYLVNTCDTNLWDYRILTKIFSEGSEGAFVKAENPG